MALAFAGQVSAGNVISGTDPTVVATPVVNHLWLVFCIANGNTNLTPTCSDNNGGAYTRLFAVQKNGGADTLSCFVRNALMPNTTSTTVTVAIGAHSATQVTLCTISGSAVAGTAAVLQTATTANGTAGGTPATVFSSAVSSSSLTISGVGNTTNPAGVLVTPGQPTWTLQSNTGQVGAGLGVESALGAVGTTVTWGGTSATTYAVGTVEVGVSPSGPGVDVSKLVSYGAIAPPVGVDVSKLVAYLAEAPKAGVNVSKLVAYLVVGNLNTNPPVWPNFTMPPGYVGNPYFVSWDLAPAAELTTYTTVVGTIPPGLTLNNVAHDVGSIAGTPTLAGTYIFTLRATNIFGTADKQFTIVISNPLGGGGAFTYVG
jgi:hypothetical protein